MENNADAIDRLNAALAQGDMDAAARCFTPDATIWHNFDGVALDLPAALAGFRGYIAYFPERMNTDIRRHPIAGGFIEQHLTVVRNAAGERRAWPVCIVFRISNGLIARLEEYIDRAGSLAIAEGAVTTPGF